MVHQTGPFPIGAQDVRLDDLFVRRARLSARCTICDHEAPVDPMQLLERHAGHTRIKAIEDKYRCSACRARGFSGVCRIVIAWDAAVEDALRKLPVDLASERRRRG